MGSTGVVTCVTVLVTVALCSECLTVYGAGVLWNCTKRAFPSKEVLPGTQFAG